MPIEVREIVIRARVEEQPASESGNSSRSGVDVAGTSNERDLQHIVSKCVEEVLTILKRQKER